jgi:putative nucleotidyltransferase with HDIG domain
MEAMDSETQDRMVRDTEYSEYSNKSRSELINEIHKLKQKERERKNQAIDFRKTKSELLRVSQALHTLGACQKALVKTLDKEKLLQKICDIIVETGEYSMAWVGVPQNNQDKMVKAIAQAGRGLEFLENCHFSLKGENGCCPTLKAIKNGEPGVIKDVLSAPQVIPWRGEAIKLGFSSVVALPLQSNGKPFGALTIYGDEPDIFEEDEVDLLMKIADSLVYGIVALHSHSERFKAESEVRKSLQKIRQALGAIIEVLEKTVEIRDPYTAGHQRRVADLARTIAGELDMPEDRMDAIRIAGIIHDIGKIYVPAEILSKPRHLSNIEFNLIKTHPQVGYEIMKSIEFPWPVAQIILQHHERLDGSGYPNNLSKEDILIEARIIGVADVVEAMASHRPYRPALGIEKALNEIEKNRGILYDEKVVDACLRIFRENMYEFQ